jgi:hypothetical protein
MMRWIVMAQSKVFMTINYAVMVEVQKTLTGHRLKLQWDSRALDTIQADRALEMFDQILAALGQDTTVGQVLSRPSNLKGLWRK